MVSDLEKRIKDVAWSNFVDELWAWLKTREKIYSHDNICDMHKIVVNDKDLESKFKNQALADFLQKIDDLTERVDEIDSIVNG